MKIAMYGSGAAGSVFASYRRKGGADMILIDRYKEHMDKVAKDGMKFTIHLQEGGEYRDIVEQLTGFRTYTSAADAAAAETGAAVEINYAYGNQFYGDPDITAAMDTWYGAGTEVVFACGGSIYTSVADAAAKANAKVIGVDTDQSGIIDGGYGEGMTVTSAMKGLATTVNDVLAKIVAGEFEGGQVATLGLVSENPEENFVQIPMTTQFNDNFTADDYKALVAAMYAGDIVVSNDTTVSVADNATVVTVNDLGNIK